MKWIALGFLALATIGCSSSGINPQSVSSPIGLVASRGSEKGTLFTYYQPKGQSKWKNNWTSGLDFTGVSWNETTCATLIAPSYVVMAAHYKRGMGSPVMFHDRNGKPYERYITSYRELNAVGDIAIGKLNLPVPSDIKAYRFANAADAAPGTAVITTDQTLTASIHEIAAVMGPRIAFKYSQQIPPIYRRNLVSGDSGHPTFILKNGDLRLLETHTTGGPGTGPFYGDPTVQAAIRTAMAEMGN